MGQSPSYILKPMTLTATKTDRDPLAHAIAKAQENLLRLQHGDGWWVGSHALRSDVSFRSGRGFFSTGQMSLAGAHAVEGCDLRAARTA